MLTLTFYWHWFWYTTSLLIAPCACDYHIRFDFYAESLNKQSTINMTTCAERVGEHRGDEVPEWPWRQSSLEQGGANLKRQGISIVKEQKDIHRNPIKQP